MSSESDPSTDAKKVKKHRFRFSLRAALVAITVLCIGPFWWIGREVHRRKDCILAAESLNRLGPGLYIKYKDNDGNSELLRAILGEDEGASAVYLNFWSLEGITDDGLAPIVKLRGLEIIILSETDISDRGVAYLRELHNITYLALDGTKVTDAGLLHLRGMQKLEELDLSETAVSDKGLEHLPALTSLSIVDLSNTNVTEEGVRQLLAAMPNLHVQKINPPMF